MRERKIVKFRVDMPDDTKFKIIDMKPERDLIHYIWYRLVLLCGKVNLYGELYMSKNIPYTIETLAIEFNRDIDQVKLALEVLMELEMVEFTEHNVYCVKNFAKHQNIKVKEKNKCSKEVETNNNEDQVNKNLEYKTYNNQDIEPENQLSENKVECITMNNNKDEIHENKNNQIQLDKSEPQVITSNNKKDNLEVAADIDIDKINEDKSKKIKNENNEHKLKTVAISNNSNSEVTENIRKIDEKISLNKEDSNKSLDKIPIDLGFKKNNKPRKKKKEDISSNITDEQNKEEELASFTDGELILGKGENCIWEMTF